jgi:hypothetical protein
MLPTRDAMIFNASMSFDPVADGVAAYAALVATGAAAWQVLQWRDNRRQHQRERAGELTVTVTAWTAPLPLGGRYVGGEIINNNDFAVRLSDMKIRSAPPVSFVYEHPEVIASYEDFSFEMFFSPDRAGLPWELSAHNGYRWKFGEVDFEEIAPGMRFDEHFVVTVSVRTTVGGYYTGTYTVQAWYGE